MVTVGTAADLLDDTVVVGELAWSGGPPAPGCTVLAQSSAHGVARPVEVTPAAPGTVTLRWCDGPQRRVAPGQSVVLYDGDVVVGGGTVVR